MHACPAVVHAAIVPPCCVWVQPPHPREDSAAFLAASHKLSSTETEGEIIHLDSLGYYNLRVSVFMYELSFLRPGIETLVA